MKLSVLINAYHAFNLLSDAILEPNKLGLKINRILRELRKEVEPFQEVQKKMNKDFQVFQNSLCEETSAKIVGGKYVCPTPELQEQFEQKRTAELMKLDESLLSLSDEEIDFVLVSEALTAEEFEAAKLRDKHDFKFGQIKFLEPFLKDK